MEFYGVPDFHTPLEFLALLAKRQGKLKKGGLPDCDKAAKSVLIDWTGWVKQHYLDLEGTIYHTMSLLNISLSKCHTEEGSVTSRTLQRTTLSPPMSVQRLLQRWAKRLTGRNWRKEIRKFLQVGIDFVFLQLCR